MSGLRVEDHREAGPDQILVVGDEHPDGHRPPPSGSVAVDGPAAVRTGTRLQEAAEERRPFGHPDQAVAERVPQRRAGVAVVGDGQANAVGVTGDADVDPGCVACMPYGVRDRLLRDAVDRRTDR